MLDLLMLTNEPYCKSVTAITINVHTSRRYILFILSMPCLSL